MVRATHSPILIAAAVMMAGCARETVAHQQPEREANHLMVVLDRAGFNPEKVIDDTSRILRFKVQVPKDQLAEALFEMEKLNLPKTQVRGTDKIFEGRYIPTELQLEAQRIAGIEGDLVNDLREFPHVVNVRVAVSIPAKDPLRDVTEVVPKPKASVMVVYDPDRKNKPPISANEFRDFVQAKLPQLNSENVKVVLVQNSSPLPGAAQAAQAAQAAIGLDTAPLGCAEVDTLMGINVCRGSFRQIVNILLILVITAGLLAGLAVISVLRALRYRHDLTRLTAEFEQLAKR